jgi:hypothetical protein
MPKLRVAGSIAVLRSRERRWRRAFLDPVTPVAAAEEIDEALRVKT